ncbi:hypothetical protein B0T24DRAFT_644170 [Lasiosphaeria ovina]|uniref:Uncharacterized protein n=1 Tax=Lasiosphaeria ovina TaxID=92902 RepID=A0AAE0JRM0_9PEZI|nr:hypothetical protein B0T24DRAFT_644170 [Lasiosphaeria ovina]
MAIGPVQNKIKTYRLREDDLKKYLKTQFPLCENFNVQLSQDGVEFWTFETPSPMTKAQMDQIDKEVRESPVKEEQEGFL